MLKLPALEPGATFTLDSDATAVACDGDLLAAGDASGRLYAWDLGTAHPLATERVLPTEISAIRVSAARRRLFAMANDERGAHGMVVQLR